MDAMQITFCLATFVDTPGESSRCAFWLHLVSFVLFNWQPEGMTWGELAVLTASWMPSHFSGLEGQTSSFPNMFTYCSGEACADMVTSAADIQFISFPFQNLGKLAVLLHGPIPL